MFLQIFLDIAEHVGKFFRLIFKEVPVQWQPFFFIAFFVCILFAIWIKFYPPFLSIGRGGDKGNEIKFLKQRVAELEEKEGRVAELEEKKGRVAELEEEKGRVAELEEENQHLKQELEALQCKSIRCSKKETFAPDILINLSFFKCYISSSSSGSLIRSFKNIYLFKMNFSRAGYCNCDMPLPRLETLVVTTTVLDQGNKLANNLQVYPNPGFSAANWFALWIESSFRAMHGNLNS